MRGLAVRTTSSGETVYWFRFRLRGEALSHTFKASGLSEARRLAEAMRVQVSRGEDPRPQSGGDLTVTRAACLWVMARRRQWRRRTRWETTGLLRRHVVDAFGGRLAGEVQRGELNAHLKRIAAKHPVTANRVLALWRSLYRWLREIDQEHLGIATDPTAGLRRPGGNERPRDRVFSNDELRAILRAAPAGDWRDFIEFLLHTGTRDSETRAMRWEHVDMARTLWTIPGSAAKNGRAHEVPLSSGALAVLRRRERVRFTGEGRVFPFARQTKVLRDVAIGAGLLVYTGTEDKESWDGEQLRLHDVRRTVGDRLRQEYGEAMMHAALGHVEARITATYGPSPRLRALAEALEWWAGELRRMAKQHAKEEGA